MDGVCAFCVNLSGSDDLFYGDLCVGILVSILSLSARRIIVIKYIYEQSGCGKTNREITRAD